MSDPQDHSRSGFEEGRGAEPDPGAEARRFWGQYARRTRPGAPRAERGDEAGNGQRLEAHPHECLDWCPICRTADVLRASASPELREQLGNLQRDALVALRALLDAYIDRVEDNPRRRRGSAVEDIPIE